MSLVQDVKTLARYSLFAVIEPEALRLLAFSTEMIVLSQSHQLFERGQMSDSAYLVVSGRIALESENVVTFIAGPDSLIGETALLATSPRPAGARALEDSRLLKITQSQFHRVMREFPESALRVSELLAQRLLRFTRALEPVRQKLLA